HVIQEQEPAWPFYQSCSNPKKRAVGVLFVLIREDNSKRLGESQHRKLQIFQAFDRKQKPPSAILRRVSMCVIESERTLPYSCSALQHRDGADASKTQRFPDVSQIVYAPNEVPVVRRCSGGRHRCSIDLFKPVGKCLVQLSETR